MGSDADARGRTNKAPPRCATVSLRARDKARHVLVPRRLDFGYYAGIIAVASLVSGFLVGFAIGVALDDIARQVLFAFSFGSAAIVGGLVVLRLAMWAVPASACRSPSFTKAIAASYLPPFAGGAVGTAIVLSLRELPFLGLSSLKAGQSATFGLVVSMAWVAFAIIVNRIRDREEKASGYLKLLEGKVQELNRSRRRITAAQEGVRRAVAERLHGPVQTQLWVLSERLKEAEGCLGTTPNEAGAIVSGVREKLNALVQADLREISRELHPSIINMGLPAALRSLCDQVKGSVELQLDISHEVLDMESPEAPGLPYDVRLALHRFAQEALTNVVRHSRAKNAAIRVWLEGKDSINMSVSDDGVGFAVDRMKPGLGTATMEDYLSAFDGSFQVHSSPGKGTRLTAVIPLG